jgi:hypothetical protein
VRKVICLQIPTVFGIGGRITYVGQNPNIKIGNKSFGRVEQFKYLGIAVTNQNSIREKMKSRLKSGNARYHSMHNLLYSSLLSKNIRIKIYRTIVLPVV